MYKSDWGIAVYIALAGASLLFSRGVIAEDRRPRASVDDSAPNGLVVVIENKPDRPLNLQVLDNPCVNGVALQIHWADIESTEGNPDWTKLDQLFAAAETSKKWVQLLIFPGFFSPRWALEGVKTEMFTLQYGPGKGTVERLPMPWDRVYLTRWFEFLKRVRDRFGKSPSFRVIAADGPTSVSAEFTLPNSPKDMNTWLNASYTPQKYIEAWQEVFQFFATEFPGQHVSLSLGFGLNINERGKIDPREHARTRRAIVDQAIRVLGRRFALQYSNLDGNPGADRGPRGTGLVISYNGRIITGFQLRTSCERNSGDMGAEGDPPLALKRSINKGMQPNKAGQHVNYLEIYEPDVLADDLQPELLDAASVFAPERTSEQLPGSGNPARREAAQPSPNENATEHDTHQTAVKPNKPFGISVVNSVDALWVGKLFDTSDATLNAYANLNTSGVTFRTSWADIEPKDGEFDFSKLDTVFDNAEKNGKWVELVLIPGFGTPDWAMQRVQRGTFAIAYGPGKGKSLPLPVPWDKTYQTRWFSFLKAVGDRYGGKTSFRKIAAAGPTSVSAEMSLPEGPDDIAQWKKLGYTSEKYIDAWRRTFNAYSSTFPHQYFSLALHPGLPIPDRSQATYARDQVISLGLEYPNQFNLQEDGLNSFSTDKTYGYRVVRDHSGKAVTGFMMATAATLRPQEMGDSNDPTDDLRLSINAGLAPNANGQVVNYLEIYEPDIVNAMMQQVLHEGHEQISKNASP